MAVRAGPGWLGKLPVAVLRVDPDGRVSQANAECEQLLNLSERQLAGQSVAWLLPPLAGSRREERTFAAFDAEIDTQRGRLRVVVASWKVIGEEVDPGF